MQANLAVGHRITTILKVLQIPRSTYYQWLSRQPSQRELENQRITDLGYDIWLSSNKVYGYKRIHVALKRQGLTVGVKRVWRLMKAIQAQSIMRRRFRKPVTQVLYAQRPNLVKHFDDMSGIWVADVTYIQMPGGSHLYLGMVFDPEARKVLSHKVSTVRDGQFVADILTDALKHHDAPRYLHTDMGSEYTSSTFDEVMQKHQIRHSYSKKRASV
ncbi:IS3 family transposase [Leuconostoc falkenbergense]|uniref:IS3 family transposase n=1 Tax=Leuconostoc falkenbergense TaxID=2766470 RepID=UPI0024A8545D|nr:IS3 family transposase [Leuconostoc falkenbergense]MDI6554084.1 IS3 family transposase [Leuconostoc falkenbergense]